MLGTLNTGEVPESKSLAKSPHDMQGGSELPSRDAILEFIRASTGAVGKREIAREFGLKGGARIALKRLIKDLEDEGAIAKRGKALQRTGVLPPVVLGEITGRDREGELVAKPVEWDEEDYGPVPRIAVHVPRKLKPGMSVPGVGDRALLRVEQDVSKGQREGAPPAYTGRIVKVLDKARSMVLGVYRALPGGGGRLAPIDKKALGREIPIPIGDENGAKDGDLVSVTVVEARPLRPHARARCAERLGSLKCEKAVSLIAIHAHGIPHVFSDRRAGGGREPRSPPRSRRAARTGATCRSSPSTRRTPRTMTTRSMRRPTTIPANPGRLRRHRRHRRRRRPMSGPARRSTARRWSAATRSTSPTASCRCCRSASRTTSARCARARTGRRSPSAWCSAPTARKRSHSFHRVMMRSAAKLVLRSRRRPRSTAGPTRRPAPLLEPVLQPLWAAYRGASQRPATRASRSTSTCPSARSC